MLEGVIFLVIGENECVGGVVNLEEIGVGIAQTQVNAWLNRREEIIVAIELAKVDVVVVNLADGESDMVVKVASAGGLLMTLRDDLNRRW